MSNDELAELVSLLGAAGHVLEGIVDDALAQPAPATLEAPTAPLQTPTRQQRRRHDDPR